MQRPLFCASFCYKESSAEMSKLSDQEQRRAAKEFYEQWKDRSDEKKDTQSFWLDLLRMVYGIENPSQFISFEKNCSIRRGKEVCRRLYCEDKGSYRAKEWQY